MSTIPLYLRFLEKYNKIPLLMSNPERKRRMCDRGIALDFVLCSAASEAGLEAVGKDGIGVETDTVPRLVNR